MIKQSSAGYDTEGSKLANIEEPRSILKVVSRVFSKSESEDEADYPDKDGASNVCEGSGNRVYEFANSDSEPDRDANGDNQGDDKKVK